MAANTCFLVVLDEAFGGHGGEKGIAALLDDSKGILYIFVQVKFNFTFSHVSLMHIW